MAKYVRKPVTVEASRWFKNGDHPRDYEGDQQGFESGELVMFTGEQRRERGWEGDVVRYFRHPNVNGESECGRCGKRMHDHGWIDPARFNTGDLHGAVVCPGDWVITEGDRIYPQDNTSFMQEYESLEPSRA